jgi:hypothetical protein
MMNFLFGGQKVEEDASPEVERFHDSLKQVKFSASTANFGADDLQNLSDAGSNVTTGESQRDFSFSKYGFTPSVDRIKKTNKSTEDGDCPPSAPKPISGSKKLDIAPASSMSRPNYEDIIKRVAVVAHRHVEKCEERLRNANENVLDTGLFHSSQMELFREENYLLPKYCYDFTTSPITRLGFQYTIRKLKPYYKAPPTFTEIHEFLKETFDKAQLTAECSIGGLRSFVLFTFGSGVLIVSSCICSLFDLLRAPDGERSRGPRHADVAARAAVLSVARLQGLAGSGHLEHRHV